MIFPRAVVEGVSLLNLNQKEISDARGKIITIEVSVSFSETFTRFLNLSIFIEDHSSAVVILEFVTFWATALIFLSKSHGIVTLFCNLEA